LEKTYCLWRFTLFCPQLAIIVCAWLVIKDGCFQLYFPICCNGIAACSSGPSPFAFISHSFTLSESGSHVVWTSGAAVSRWMLNV
jgi:hypothetical protein